MPYFAYDLSDLAEGLALTRRFCFQEPIRPGVPAVVAMHGLAGNLDHPTEFLLGRALARLEQSLESAPGWTFMSAHLELFTINRLGMPTIRAVSVKVSHFADRQLNQLNGIVLEWAVSLASNGLADARA